MSYPGYPPGPPSGGYPPPQQPTGYPPQQPGMPMPPGGGAPYPPGQPTQPGPWVPGASPGGAAPYGMPPPPSAGGYPPQPTMPPPTGGFGFGSGPPPPSGPAPYPPGPSQYPPSGPTPGYPSATPYSIPPPTQQTPGGYSNAPPPVPSAYTHKTATGSSHGKHHTPSSVSQATKGVASMSVSKGATYKEPPTEGTIKPHSPFDAEADAKKLRTAMKGFGTDEKAIISVLAYRSNSQRQEIKRKFIALYGKDLIKELKGELSGHFEDVVLGLMMRPPEFDAFVCRKAMKGAGTDEEALIEVLCTRTNEEISALKQQYKKDHGRNLEKDVASETSGHFKRLLISMLTGSRDPNGPVDQAKATADAQALYNAGEAKWGTDESKFNQILAARSYTHLRAVFQEYSKICKYDIEQSISREMSGDLKDGMLTIVKCVRNRPAYFAECLYKSMKGLGTNDNVLVRVMVSRCEVDMVQIKDKFYSKYHKSLGSFIKGDTSGDYKRILMALAREEL